MNAEKSLRLMAVFIMAIIWLAACNSTTPTPFSATNIQNINITESNTTSGQITQTRLFNQCDAAGPITVTVQFSQNNSQSTQKELIISGGGDVGVAIPGDIVSAKLQGAITDHFAVVRASGSGYQESVQITIPDHVQQEYTLVWRETRSEGIVNYTENGAAKFANYSYRVGLTLLSSVARKIDCSIQVTETPTLIPVTETPLPQPTSAPVVKTLADGCIYAGTWLIDSTDQDTLNSITKKTDDCYETGALGMFSDRSGVLHILDRKKHTAVASGIYVPISSDAVIEFKVHVSSMYIANTEKPAYIDFAITPFNDPMTTKNTARFKLQVEEMIANSPLVYFVLADAGENSGAKFPSQHYEYGRTYTVRFELIGSITNIFINNIKLNETLSIPPGSKAFYIGYNLPPFAGIEADVTNIKIDNSLK